ncbi:hypothetical protein [Micromonospora chersina]|uniref:hypothetical protein n=1 Tax=Micromonospora chersina TaxID=47854 RepID=UPI003408E766
MRRRPVRRRPVRPQPRERVRLTDWLQGISSLLAVVLAAPALVVAVVTYRDQQQINRAQLDMTLLEHQRYEQRFASRVAAWQLRNPAADPRDPVRVRVQNRSPVPIKQLHIEADSEDVLAWPDGPRVFELPVDIPPCSLLTFRLESMVQPRYRMTRISVTLWFSDPVGLWQVGAHGVVSAAPDDFRAVQRSRGGGYGVELPEQRETAADCGESG